MDDGIVKYSSYFYFCNDNQPENDSSKGLKWTVWKSLDYPATDNSDLRLNLKWEFEWDDSEGVDGYEGYINFRTDLRISGSKKINIDKTVNVKLTKSQKMVEYMIDFHITDDNISANYILFLKPIRQTVQKTDLDKNFELSETTDAILIVEGKKMHVNKGNLSFHSAYFRTLFNSEFKEKSMEEIPIEGVKYSEFARLLSVIHPNPIFVTEESCESLLELADRFIMSSVTRHVEHFLLSNLDLHFSPIGMQPERILELADRFNLPDATRHVEKSLMKGSQLRFCHVLKLAEKFELDELKETMFNWICTKEHMKKIKASSEYAGFSDACKIRLFERLLNI